MKSPVFLAVDRPDLEGAQALVQPLADVLGGIKLGLEFTTANGPQGVRRMAALGLPVFLDLKFHDIPNTVAGAVRAAGALEVAMLTLHAAGGAAMLRAAASAARELEPRPLLLGVSVLTSMSDDDLAATGVAGSTLDQVLRLAGLALNAGLDGLVCSPLEIAALRARFGRDVRLVVPGIRPPGSLAGDQKRTLSASEALARGADILVIGRPISAAPSPREAALAIQAEIAGLVAA